MTRASDTAKLLGAGATILDGTTISTADNTTQLTLTSTDADSSVGPVLDLVRNSASPADGDGIGQIKFIADNDAGEATTYSSAFTTLRDASNGAEDGQTINYVMTGGALVDHLRMGRSAANGQSEVIINEGSADIDFRVESDGNTHAIFVEGSTGNVGIGNSDPTTTVTKFGGSAQGLAIKAGQPVIAVEDTSNAQYVAYLAQSETDSFLGGIGGGSLIIQTGTSGSERMRIDSSGNVGISTSNPLSQLTIGGNVNTTAKPTVAITDTTNGATMSMRGQSPKIAFDVTSSGVPKILMDNAGLEFKTGTLDAEGDVDVKIDSSGNFLVGTTSTVPFTFTSGTGAGITSTGTVMAGAAAEAGLFNRIGSDGSIVNFYKAGTIVGNIGTIVSGGAGRLSIGNSNTKLLFNNGEDNITPANNDQATRDNAIDLGSSSARFDDVFATNSSIQTSDRNEKQDIEELTDAEKRVAVVAKGLMRKFRWKDKVAEKGDNARTHFGIIAQDLQDAFTAESLDASKYAMFCSDTWWEKEISVDAVEADNEKGIEAKDAYTYTDTKQEATEGYTEKTRLGVRYSELLAFIISAI